MDAKRLVIAVDIVYTKTGFARYLSHLDLNRTFQRALRRSSLPVVLTSGFNPRIKIRYKRALAVGKKSWSEEMTIFLCEKVSERFLKKRLQNELPKGINLRKVKVSNNHSFKEK